jgi:hypothetical protein
MSGRSQFQKPALFCLFEVLGNFCVGFCSFSMFFLRAEFLMSLFSSPKDSKDKPAGIMEQIKDFCSFSNSEIFLHLCFVFEFRF